MFGITVYRYVNDTLCFPKSYIHNPHPLTTLPPITPTYDSTFRGACNNGLQKAHRQSNLLNTPGWMSKTVWRSATVASRTVSPGIVVLHSSGILKLEPSMIHLCTSAKLQLVTDSKVMFVKSFKMFPQKMMLTEIQLLKQFCP